MTDSPPSTIPPGLAPFTIPPGLELRHLLDACPDAEELRGQANREQYLRLTCRYEVACDRLLGAGLSKMVRFEAVDQIRQVRAQSFLCEMNDEQFAWVAEAAGDRAARRQAASA